MHNLAGITRIVAYRVTPIALIAIALFFGPVTSIAVHGSPPLSVDVKPLVFDSANPVNIRFGELEWRGGIALTSNDQQFGGFSGLSLGPDGRHLVGVSDIGQWLTADVVYVDGRMVRLDNVKLSRILGAPGERLNGKVERDSEGIAIAVNGDVLVSFERYHRVARYDFAGQGAKARATYIELPKEISGFSANKGFESVGQFGENSQLSGQILVIAERYLDELDNHSAWLLTPHGAKRLSIKRSLEFDITDLAILPDGRVIILERRYSIFFGPAMRLRLITPHELVSGAPIQGRTLLVAKSHLAIDNMEGLSVHVSPEGETILTLISDDNFRDSQRTLMMQFALR